MDTMQYLMYKLTQQIGADAAAHHARDARDLRTERRDRRRQLLR